MVTAGLVVMALLTGCQKLERRASWWVFPLPRHHPADGLAVVTRAGGRGIHIWLDPDTDRPGICRPRWNPDAARLIDGNGPQPTSMGRAPRQEFFEAVGSSKVRWALRRQMAALCAARDPHSRFLWSEPPRSDTTVESFPMVEKWDLLSPPKAVKRAEKQLFGLPLTPADYHNEIPPPEPPGP